jgi:multidrug efflux system outer membrane protein
MIRWIGTCYRWNGVRILNAPSTMRKIFDVLKLTGGALLCGFLVTGCLVGPDYVAPDEEVPGNWQGRSGSKSGVERSKGLETWWEGYHDPTLNKLIARAGKENPTLKIAVATVWEARAARGVQASQLFPALSGGGAYERSRMSESVGVPVPQNPSNLFSTGFDAGWEIDVFGGIRRSIESADATIGGQAEFYRDVMISLYAEVALSYIEIRTLEQRLYLTEQNLVLQRKSVEITESRFKAGLAPEIDPSQAYSNLYSTEATVPQLEEQLVATRNRLATLLGGFPEVVNKLLGEYAGIPDEAVTIPAPPQNFGYGLPTELIRARPDIRQAERQLAAQTALIGVAVADLYPRFALFGSFGPQFSWDIFTAGRVRSFISQRDAQTEQALYAYENTVLGAVAEVESSLVSIVKEKQRLLKLQAAVKSTSKTVELITSNYTPGLVDFQNVLDAQRTLFADQNAAAASEGTWSANYVRLFKALGGGAPVETTFPELTEKVMEREAENKRGIFGRKKSEKAEVETSAPAEAATEVSEE